MRKQVAREVASIAFSEHRCVYGFRFFLLNVGNNYQAVRAIAQPSTSEGGEHHGDQKL
jgi:hypothetical protein